MQTQQIYTSAQVKRRIIILTLERIDYLNARVRLHDPVSFIPHLSHKLAK